MTKTRKRLSSSMKRQVSDEDITRRFWGELALGKKKGDYPVHWLQSQKVLRHCVNPRISGDSEVDWIAWVHATFLPVGVERGFVLGCGGGTLEREMARRGACESFHAVDISPDAVLVAQTLSEREGWSQFTYEAADANYLSLEPDSFDLILADMALHHITKLEHVLDQFHTGLRPDGLLVLNEFVGPDRFQWSDEQLMAATRLIRSLPLRLRRNRDLVRWKRYLKPWVRTAKRWSPQKMARVDPSESVRSSEIPSLVAERFDVLARRQYGGAILGLVLNNIVGNFTKSSEDLAILERLATEEEVLTSQGRLSSDYELIVARKPS